MYLSVEFALHVYRKSFVIQVFLYPLLCYYFFLFVMLKILLRIPLKV